MKLPIIIAAGTLTTAIAYNAYALTCGAQPSCDSLGYKYTGATTDCVNTPMKCPFNSSYFNCTKKADVMSYSKNTSSWWYQDKATGLIFQGGKVNVTSNSDYSVSYNKSFTNPPMTLVLTPYNQPTNASGDVNYLVSAVNVTAYSFKIRYADSDDQHQSRRQGYVSWFAVGY